MATLSNTGTSVSFGQSNFAVSFQLDAPHTFSFSSLITGTDEQSEPQLFSSSNIEWETFLGPFRIPGPTVFDRRGRASQLVSDNGLLAAGEYLLFVNLSAQANRLRPGPTMTATGDFSFTFDLTQTPEPASLLLFGSGLLGVVARRRPRAEH
jgi:hypothetical protein